MRRWDRLVVPLFVPILVLTCGLALAGTASLGAAPSAWAADGGVQNPGFETAAAPGSGQAALGWTIVSQAVAGNVARIQKDDSSTYAVFGTVSGGTTVTPRTGDWMLRFGIPKGTDMHQAKGVTTVAQTFVSDGSDIGVAFRVFTWEHNDTDAFIVDVKDLTTGKSVGRLADKEPQSITGTTVILGTGTLPYTLDLKVEPRQVKYKDTGWQDVRITGLDQTVGHSLKIVYTLDTNTTASHDSWVYLDLTDIIPPVVSISAPADGSVVNADPVLAFTAADEAGGSGLGTAAAVVKVDGAAVTASNGTTLGGLADGSHTVSVTVADKAGNKGTGTSTFTLDKTAPATTASGTPPANAAGWNSGPVTVTLTATDATSGVAATYYKVNGGAQQTYDAAARPVLSADGDTLSYWSEDKAGNAGVAKSFTVKIDAVEPTISVSGLPDGPSLSPVTLTFTPELGLSGIEALEYSLDGVTWTEIQAPLAGLFYQATFTEDGAYTVSYRVTNKAGVTSTVGSCAFTIHSSSLSVELTSPLPGPTGYNRPVVAFTTTGGGSASLDAEVKVDGTPVSLGAGGVLPRALSRGVHTISVRVSDGASPLAATASVQVDIEPPEFTLSQPDPSEGDTIAVCADGTAATGNPDGSWAGKVWAWTIRTGDQEPVTMEGPVGYVLLDNAGTYQIGLSVTDASGAICETEQSVTAKAEAPRVHALDIEVIRGQKAKLVARLLDPGFEQAHSATWEIDGIGPSGADLTIASTETTLMEDNLATMDSGFITGVTPVLDAAPGELHGHLTVSDPAAQTTVPFTITVLPDTHPTADSLDDGDGAFATATALTGGKAYLSYIQSRDDVDIYKVATPGHDHLPYGTEVLATLRDLPEDYDLAVVQDLGQTVDTQSPDFQRAAFEGTSFATAGGVRHIPFLDAGGVRHIPYVESGGVRHIPFQDAGGVRHIPYVDSAYMDAGGVRHIPYVDAGGVRHIPYDESGGVRHIPFYRDPLESMLFTHGPTPAGSLDGYSFSDMGYTGLDASATSGTEVSWEELGFDNESMGGKQVAGFSANPGTQDEVVLARTDFFGGDTYILVKGANGAFCEDEPYTLQIETSVPTTTVADLNAGKTPSPKVPTPQTTAPAVIVPQATPETLFVTQPERMDAIYGTSDVPTPFEDEILQLLESEELQSLVRAETISVPAGIYGEWDQKPWDTQLANGVAEKIRGYIQGYLRDHETVEFVVLVGGDSVVPQRRVPDQTVLGNERAYAGDSLLKSDSPLLASMFDASVLTDDYYVDAEPIAYNGHALFIPDLAVSRLVETPAEVAGAIQQFITSGGLLTGGSSVVTGTDFMSDGAARVKSALDAALATPARVIDGQAWTAADVRRDVLTDKADITSLNAHFLHYAGISAAGYSSKTWDPGELVTGTQIAAATDFTGKLVFSMGCHAGLNVPDEQMDVVPVAAGATDPRTDIAQAMARRQGVLVGSTGYGFGDTEAVAGTEALAGDFAAQATAGTATTGRPIGLALAAAKREYLGSLSTVTPYDEKSSIQFTMYGMPQYRLSGLRRTQTQALSETDSAKAAGRRADPASVALTVIDGGTTNTYTVPLARVASPTGSGSYYTADGDYQATAGRPIQPRIVVPLPSGGVSAATACVVSGGAYVEDTAFDPAISTWTTEWTVGMAEYQAAITGWWPANMATITTIQSPRGAEQRLVVLPGQFMKTSAAGAQVIGTERLWTRLTVEIVRPAAPSLTDQIAPTVKSVDVTLSGGIATAVVEASDASGITRIDLTQEGTSPVVHGSTTGLSGSGAFTATLGLAGVPAGDVSLVVSVFDGTGHVTSVTAKGQLVTVSPPDLVASVPYAVGFQHVLAIKSDGTLWSWGSDNAGELGDGTPGGYRSVPAQVGSDNDWASVAAGGDSSFAIKNDGSLWAWGANWAGELGDGSTTDRAVPTRVGTGNDWAAVSCGAEFTVAFKTDGTLWAWGRNDRNQVGDGTFIYRSDPTLIAGPGGWVSASCGAHFAVALKSDGSIWGWGDNGFGQFGDGTSGNRHATPTRIGTANDWAEVAAGVNSVIARKADGSIYGWGENNHGQLGIGGTTNTPTPTRIGMANDWTHVFGTNLAPHSLAMKAGGSIWAWGSDSDGQLGDGSTTDRDAPIQAGTDTDWQSLSANGSTTLALKADGKLWAWGDNSKGQLGDGTTLDGSVPRQVFDLNDVTPPGGSMTLNGGAPDTCSSVVTLDSSGVSGAIRMRTSIDGLSWTSWRPIAVHKLVALTGLPGSKAVRAQFQDLGGNQLEISRPVELRTASLSSWGDHSLALRFDGTLWAWGRNMYGELGDGTTTDRVSATQTGRDGDWAAVGSGWYHSVAIKSDGTLWSWGRNNEGQLGWGATDLGAHSSPAQIGTESTWMAVTAGDYHTLALKSDGTLWAWGWNDYGQLGLGDTMDRSSPIQVGSGTDWVAVAAGGAHSLALKSDGSLWAWGNNADGELGDGNTTQRTSPIQVGNDTYWVAVGAGAGHSVALKSDGTIFTWGLNLTGQLGNGTSDTTPHPDPAKVGSDADWVSVSAGTFNTSALKAGGTLYLWGDNSHGQLGDGTHAQQVSPMLVPGGTTWSLVSAGRDHPLGLADNDWVLGWGDNTYGQVGDSMPPADVTSPLQVFNFTAPWITTFAGLPGSPAAADGLGVLARLTNPSKVACDSAGNVYVADAGNHTIRKISVAGWVTTFAGTAGSVGTLDGTGSAALFDSPTGIACDAAGNVYVADNLAETIRKITPAGVVTTLAGNPYTSGSTDGTGSAALFHTPSDVACDAAGNVYVADVGNSLIRRITPAGDVTTFAGTQGTVDNVDGNGTSAHFYAPAGLAFDAAGDLYVADQLNFTIRKITPARDVTTIAGTAGTSGSADGHGLAASFLYPADVTCDAAGNVYVADAGNNTIRKIAPGRNVTTVAGLAGAGNEGSTDGTPAIARFWDPTGITSDAAGTIYIADYKNHTIRKMK